MQQQVVISIIKTGVSKMSSLSKTSENSSENKSATLGKYYKNVAPLFVLPSMDKVKTKQGFVPSYSVDFSKM